MPARLRYLLIQARDPGDPSRPEEAAQFARRLSAQPHQLRSVCLLTETLRMDLLQGVDMVLVGGSGAYSVRDDHDGIRAAKDFLGEVAATGFPTFASCFGFQLLVDALGGRVEPDHERTELGTTELTLTPEGQADPVFGQLPHTFNAQMGHKDRAVRWPDDAVVNLASSALVPYQALRVRGTPVYAAQFHPELTAEENRHRFRRYYDDYSKAVGQDAAETLMRDGFEPSQHAATLLGRYQQHFFDVHLDLAGLEVR